MFQKQAQAFNNFTCSGYNKTKNDQVTVSGFPTIFPTQNAGVTPIVGRSYINYPTNPTANTYAVGSVPKFAAGKNLKGHLMQTNAAWLPSNS